VNIERTQHIGHYGVTFTVMRFTVVPENRNALANLCVREAKTRARQVRDQIGRLYEKMLARDLPCDMAVAVSFPLSRSQADRLNDQNVLIKQIFSSAVKRRGLRFQQSLRASLAIRFPASFADITQETSSSVWMPV